MLCGLAYTALLLSFRCYKITYIIGVGYKKMLHELVKIVPYNIFSIYCSNRALPVCLQACDLQSAHLYRATVRVDAPAVALNAVDAVGVAHLVVDVHRADAVVGGDDDVISVVGGALEHITVVVGKESAALLTLLLKVDLAGVVALVVDDERVEHVGVGAAHQRDAEFVAVAAGLHRKLDAVLVSQTRE